MMAINNVAAEYILGTNEKFIDEEKPAEKPAKSAEAAKLQEKAIVESNEKWADALAGVIKKYPVNDL